MHRLTRLPYLAGIVFLWPLMMTQSLAFENTKVLPKGVRNASVRTLYTTARTKTNRDGNIEPLAEPLWRPLRFRHVVSGETGLKRKQLEALLLQQNWSQEKTLGNFRAELDAQINVWAPIIAFGISDRLTLAIAVPVYNSSTDIKAGFTSNGGAEEFISALTDPAMNQTHSAVEAAEKLQNAIGRLNEKLTDNNYGSLEKWNATGLGDVTVAAKMLISDHPILKTATSFGFVAPTGEKDSPDILTDLSFGDGQWDLFAQLTFDQILYPGIILNEFYKYTYQAPGKREMRLKTAYESIEVEKENLDFKLGDKVESGVSLQFEQYSTGLTAGLGLQYLRKFGDRYQVEDRLVEDELQKDTDQDALYWKASLGYSTVAAYQRKEFAVPLVASIEYRKQYQSRNSPRTDFTQIDVGFFF